MMSMRNESPSPASEDSLLVEQCLAGNAAAWNALIEKYKRLIYAIPFRYGASASDADDIFQTVCLELYEELPRLRQSGALRGWLSTVTARQSLYWKKRNMRRGETGLEDAPEPSTDGDAPTLELLERGQLVHDALGSLPERCQRMLRMLFFDDPPRPYEEVARSLGLAIGSIGFIRGRCMEKLRQALEEAGF